ncbi:MAG: hypothetical protein ACI9MX_001441 [Candidatus Aldehydirespiratoraceae bacterium]|jgi:hypothetical protein
MCLAASVLLAMGWSLTLSDLWRDLEPCGNVWSHPPTDACSSAAADRLSLVLVVFVTPAAVLLLVGAYRLRFGTGDIIPKRE